MAYVADRVDLAREAIARRSSDETDELLATAEADSPLSRDELRAGSGAERLHAAARIGSRAEGAFRTSKPRAVERKGLGEPVEVVPPGWR